MFPIDGDNNFQNETYANIPNISLMYMLYTPTFGNMSFAIQPAIPGKTQSAFPSVPYVPLEGLLYMGQASNPAVAPVNVLTGNTTGQQTTTGTQTSSDQFGTSRYMMGYQNGTSGL